jgi:hypothetical protein
METHDSLSVCPNVMTGVRLEEGPSGREPPESKRAAAER